MAISDKLHAKFRIACILRLRRESFSLKQFERAMSFDGDLKMQKRKAFVRKANVKADDYRTIMKTQKVLPENPFVVAVVGSKNTWHWFVADGK